ncbi:3-oxoacyl-[acyl-carrier-protein] synthase III C-terminal domain-containing protein [Paraburkholderia nodosa]|uniref:3-oxoacyl-[acyl-carrier-protein] synthase III C-terminal domain-containing protein n=1 Tax=Paraburkholderia nodosa TaxID=392320 RepID=UPI001FE0A457|nr:3-oxoacyl-[acyl-carrier-protein] synthase III C-terminal domain-containing protein [Paraburkholderia nodosa]
MRSVYADTLRWSREVTDRDPVAHLSAVARTAMPLHVASEPQLLLSEMATRVAAEAVGQCPDRETVAPDQVIVCATSFEQDLALSCAGRLHGELGSTGAPFAIGQLQGVSFFLALQMVSDMMAGDEHLRCALIVGAERWLPPFSRLAGSLTTLADGAAAVLVRRRLRPAWDVLAVNVWTPSAPVASHDACVDEAAVVELIGQTCTRAGVTPRVIDWTVPARIDATLARSISAQARLPDGQMSLPDLDETGYLCAADTPAQLDALLRSATPSDGQHILLWSAGLQGQAGCAILQYRASQS